MNRIFAPPRGELHRMKTPALRAFADRIFSQWIRLRYVDVQSMKTRCFTCGRYDFWYKLECGHFVPRANSCTRYHELNCHPQCKTCNGFMDGNLDVYAVNLDKKYGPGTADRLRFLGRQMCKISRPELVDLILETDKKIGIYL